MGLDKRKQILVREDFEVDPFKATNQMLSAQDRSTLPASPDDVMLDRHQSVYYSVEYALKRLMQNDEFIETFLKASQSQIELAVNRGLLTSQNVDSSIATPESTQIYPSFFKLHEYEYHGATGPAYSQYASQATPATFMMSAVNATYADTDMSNFDEAKALTSFQKRSDLAGNRTNAMLSAKNDIKISNDVIVDIEYNDSPTVRRATNYVNVTVLNKKTRGVFRQNIVEQVSILDTVPSLTECTYIYKRWLSGFKELYVYIPSTFTFYNSNEHGEDVNGNATWICLKINKRHFQLNHIYQAHICGQSLPMQIHNELSTGVTHFNDVILPSMLRTMCTSPDENTNTKMVYDSYNAQYVLYFVCYGTDAQAIRIFGD